MSSSSSWGGPVGMCDAIQLRCHDTGSGGMGLCREAKSWSGVAGRYHLRHRRAVRRPRVCVAISTTGDWMKRVFSGSSEYYKSANHPNRAELLSEARFSRELEWHRTNYERVGEIEPPPIFPFWRKQEFEARSLTRKVLELTRKRQLNQILKLVETAKQERYELHRITMNAVMEACVHCNDTDRAIGIFEEMLRPGACGVDTVTYGILIKGLGQAKRLSDAFLVFEAIEKGTAPGAPKLSDVHLNTLVNACAEAGESLRARGILLRYRSSVDQSGPSAFTYNLLIKGYARSDNPLEALKVIDEMRSNGLEPQQLTYNSLILACVRGGDTLKALDFLRRMKEEAKNSPEMLPDVVTYTTLIKGLALDGDLQRVLDMVDEMKQTPTCVLDRVAYTAIIDACIEAGSPRQGFVMLQELKERGQENPALRPRAHVFLALMRAFADEGDVEMVTSLRERLIPEAAGFVWPEERAEADELLMEAAVAAGQLGLAKHVLRTMVGLKKGIPLTRRAYMAVVRLQALTGFKEDIFSPLQLRVPPSESVDRVMLPFAEANTVSEDLKVADVAFRFFREDVIPVVDKAGAYVGSVHCRDCTEMDARLGDIKKRTPIVTNATPVSKVVSLLLKSPSPFITVIDSRTASYRKGDLLEGQVLGFLVPSSVFLLDSRRSWNAITTSPNLDQYY